MDRQLLRDLLEKYAAGTCTDEERELLHRFYDSFQTRGGRVGGPEEEANDIRADIFAALNARIAEDEPRKVPGRFKWHVAASVVLAISLFTAFYFNFYTDEVPPITQTTQNGERMTVTLPDGSEVKLNAGSKLSYPESFAGTRKVILTGEAFFDVEANPDKPFVVETGAIRTTVLGTSFNVNAYSSRDEIKVTVATGKVKVASGTQSLNLLPGEQATYSTTADNLVMRAVDVENFVAWAEGTLLFDGASLREVAEALSRWYGVDISFDQPQFSDACDLKLSFRDLSLRQALDQISLITGIEYQFDGNGRVRIMGVGCAD